MAWNFCLDRSKVGWGLAKILSRFYMRSNEITVVVAVPWDHTLLHCTMGLFGSIAFSWLFRQSSYNSRFDQRY